MSSTAELTITTADASHLDALVVQFERYRVDFYKQVPGAQLARRFLAQRLERGDSTIFVALVGGELAGFVQPYPLLDSLKLGNLFLLNDLYVDPPHRGRGYSKQLLSRAKELARASNATGLLLETQKTNEVGNRLYPSVGFKFDDEFNYYFWTSDAFSPAAGETGLVVGAQQRA